ncbi:MAG: DNA gyrase/topoisomerase IV subunit A [Flavobacteriales bacterium]|nr:DNA gyrase/topoisomerase IV subunit A [Flavobacteriales bacterium]MCX7649999.1 DNA gyrase/topoisomerase IV subunit A [Flavobacteriales bacterium]MDW8432020.1 DNA gyrase/topoisomerase IV subunit A [Flavobacteriales bacterium]
MADTEYPASGPEPESHAETQITALSGMYQNYFLDYASYVILERAVPALEDGLKPVQRRILHSMWELEDGRYNKVANIVGNTMKYHPHGDASITDAIVQLGQRELLIDTQGNWGNIFTGDSAAAPRYIEARLTPLALDTVYHPKLTEWQPSYDGRNKEPVALPVRFPLLLAQGVEGIAVGLACKILPHNFRELCEACILVLQGKPFQLFPDFPTGGLADCSRYQDGRRGGRIRVRAKLTIIDHKTLCITEIPYGTTTDSLIESILGASEKGKIKIKKIEDNTAERVEILLHLAPGAAPDTTVEALYAFTDCEVSLSPNACVIYKGKPVFLGVSDILRFSAENTRQLLEKELQIKLGELQEAHLFASLEKIFIEEKIYRHIEECETWDSVLQTIEKGLRPFAGQFYRPITQEDVVRLTEIRIKRISRYDARKADEALKALEKSMSETRRHLERINEYTIRWFEKLLKTYGAKHPRKTELAEFDSVALKKIVQRNEKLYYDKESGFLGWGLKTGRFVADCSELDDVLIFTDHGQLILSRVEEKKFVGKNIVHLCLWHRDDDTIYTMIFRDGKQGPYVLKRFRTGGITRDKVYDLTRGTPGSSVVYFTAQAPGTKEIITVHLKPKPRLKKLVFDVALDEVAVRQRDSQGLILSRLPIRKIVRKSLGQAQAEKKPLWFDDTIRRFSFTEKGRLVGYLAPGERVLVVGRNGLARWIVPEPTTYFDENPFALLPCPPGNPVTFIYKSQGSSSDYMVKRFIPETPDKIYTLFPDEEAEPVFISAAPEVVAEITFEFGRHRELRKESIPLHQMFPIKSETAKGSRLSTKPVKDIVFTTFTQDAGLPTSQPESPSAEEIIPVEDTPPPPELNFGE